MDIPLSEALIGWDRDTDTAAVVVHPDERRLSDRFSATVGACFATWRDRTDMERKLLLMVEVWHAVAFYDISPNVMHEALLVIPEYRSMLADDCLPKRFQHERD